MEFYLFDTNVISDLFNPRRTNHQAVRRELNGLPSEAPKFISVVVLGELRFGLHLAKHTGQELSHIRGMFTVRKQICPDRPALKLTG